MINQQGQEHFLLATKVYKQRFYQFLQDLDDIQGLKSVRVAKKVLNLLPKIQKLENSDTLIFYSDFLISISRLLEAYSLNAFGQRRFKKTTDFHGFIELRFNDFINAFNNWQVKPFEQFEVLEQAKVNIKQNLDVVKQIVQSEIVVDQIDQYFQQIKVYNFTANNTIIGISSYDGKRLYFRETNDENLYFIYFQKIIKSVMDNIYFWFISNTNPFLIMAEVNSDLIDRGTQIEAGDFYIVKVFKETIFSSPFKMNTNTKNYFLF